MAMDLKMLARRTIEELFDRGDVQYLDEVSDLSFVGHDPIRPRSVSLDDTKEIAKGFRDAFPDLACSVEDVVTEGSKVICRWRMTGTHRGPLLGAAPTGKLVAFDGITEMRFHGDRLAEQWTLYDCLGLLSQVGLVPSIQELTPAPSVEAGGEPGTIHLPA